MNLIFLFSIILKAGIVIGYQGGKWVPGLATLQTELFLKEQKYGANFNYNQFFHGAYFGFRYDFKKWWVECNWNNKHNSFESGYTINGLKFKEEHEIKLNTFTINGGYKFKGWGIGLCISMANFSLREKRARLDDYSSANWYHEHGGRKSFLNYTTYHPVLDFCIDREVCKYVILKFSTSRVFKPLRFNDNHTFKPNNISLALLFNFTNIKKP